MAWGRGGRPSRSRRLVSSSGGELARPLPPRGDSALPRSFQVGRFFRPAPSLPRSARYWAELLRVPGETCVGHFRPRVSDLYAALGDAPGRLPRASSAMSSTGVLGLLATASRVWDAGSPTIVEIFLTIDDAGAAPYRG